MMKSIKIKIAALLSATLLFGLISMANADDSVPPADTTLPAANENILIRNGDNIIYQGTVELPATGTASITDDTGATHSINADSVLGILSLIASANTGTFSLSDIQYYAPGAMGPSESFYFKCITPNGQSALCQNWQYVVNGVAPWVGMDATILSGGETIGVYFGSPHQLILNATSIMAGEQFTATAQKYNYIDNTRSPLTGVTVGVTQPNPNDPYDPTVVTSQAVDASGSATFTLANAGTYNVGIAEDYYFPSYGLTVDNASPGGGSGGLGGGEITTATFDVQSSLNYLYSIQGSDGSFAGSNLYTDWVGIALGASNASSSSRANIISYMANHNAVSSLLTDNERRATALLSLGQNPYSFNGADYITPIVNSFDGTQFGDPSLDNDDIFALIPLSSAGYAAGDAIIAKDITFLISRQQPNGSWDGSIDLTAAAVQALEPFSNVPGVPAALINASIYLANTQGNDGGWGNISSSSWAAQAMSGLGATWIKNGKTVANYLYAQQAADGAALPSSEMLQNRIWATAYAIPAALGKSWSEIMQSVSMPATSSGGAANTNSYITDNPAGTNGNSNADEINFSLLMSQWGQTGPNLSADLNHDGIVDKHDFGILMANWTL